MHRRDLVALKLVPFVLASTGRSEDNGLVKRSYLDNWLFEIVETEELFPGFIKAKQVCSGEIHLIPKDRFRVVRSYDQRVADVLEEE